MSSPDWHSVLVIAGLTGVTVLARAFFLIPEKTWTLPNWAQRALQYAPIAALSAVVVPEVVTNQGVLLSTFQDARVIAAAAGAAAYFWRKDVLVTIVVGMAVFLPLHVALGW